MRLLFGSLALASTMAIGYTGGADTDYWNGEIEMLTTGGPAVPGIAAMVPFAGIAAIRRRRRR